LAADRWTSGIKSVMAGDAPEYIRELYVPVSTRPTRCHMLTFLYDLFRRGDKVSYWSSGNAQFYRQKKSLAIYSFSE